LRVVSVRMNWPGQFIIVRLDKGLGLVLMVSKGPTTLCEQSIRLPTIRWSKPGLMINDCSSINQPNLHWVANEGH
jgi:hypothetical protein